MKKITLMITGFLLASSVFSQQSVESFVPEIPGPESICGLKIKDKDKVMSDIREFSDRVKEEIRYRKKDQDKKEEEYRKQAEAHIADQYGLSQADINKLKNSENLSEAEEERITREMANKMMMNSAGISMEEIESFKDDTTGMTAWAQGYSTQKMAEQSIDPEKAKREQMHSMSMYELANTQKNLTDSLFAIESKFGKMFKELDDDTTGKKTLRELDSLQAKLYSMMGVDYGQGPEMEAILASMKSKSMAYCNKFSSRYNEILTDYRRYVVSSIPAWKRLQVITEKMNEKQAGIKMQETPGTMALESIDRYMYRMLSMDKYYLMSQFQTLSGGDGE